MEHINQILDNVSELTHQVVDLPSNTTESSGAYKKLDEALTQNLERLDSIDMDKDGDRSARADLVNFIQYLLQTLDNKVRSQQPLWYGSCLRSRISKLQSQVQVKLESKPDLSEATSSSSCHQTKGGGGSTNSDEESLMTQNNDEHHFFALNVAEELRKLSPEKAAAAKFQISGVMFDIRKNFLFEEPELCPCLSSWGTHHLISLNNSSRPDNGGTSGP